jgi:hypothetical protein
MSIGNTTLKFYYPNLTTLFDLLQPHLINIELLMEKDEDEYKTLLTTTVVNPDNNKKFPQITKAQIMKDQQENYPEEKYKYNAFDRVSVILKIIG